MKHPSPIRVTPRPSSVPVLAVQPSRMVAVGADHETRVFTAIMNRLRRRAERGERVDHGSFADAGVAGYADMGQEPHAGCSSTCGPTMQ